MTAALRRFRVMAYVVGVFLLILVGVAMPVKYLGGQATLVAIVGPIHGFLYIVYLVAAFDLAVRARWRFRRTVAILLAGTIPAMSFVAERKATAWLVGGGAGGRTGDLPEQARSGSGTATGRLGTTGPAVGGVRQGRRGGPPSRPSGRGRWPDR